VVLERSDQIFDLARGITGRARHHIHIRRRHAGAVKRAERGHAIRIEPIARRPSAHRAKVVARGLRASQTQNMCLAEAGSRKETTYLDASHRRFACWVRELNALPTQNPATE
jgi:hypothetical protein